MNKRQRKKKLKKVPKIIFVADEKGKVVRIFQEGTIKPTPWVCNAKIVEG